LIRTDNSYKLTSQIGTTKSVILIDYPIPNTHDKPTAGFFAAGEVGIHMTNAATGQIVTELAATRQMILDSFGDNGSEATDLENMSRLAVVETRIACATFETDAEKLAGLLILFELNDAPDFADQFKAKLFSRIHEFT
jgi:hypothetical protein